ncbi:hypothetical protein L9F63_020562, partial [Diploptera punctata]
RTQEEKNELSALTVIAGLMKIEGLMRNHSSAYLLKEAKLIIYSEKTLLTYIEANSFFKILTKSDFSKGDKKGLKKCK